MPKCKTHKASQRRLRVTKSGKIVRRQTKVRHLLTNRSPKQRRQLRHDVTTTAKGYVRKIRRAQRLSV